MKLIIKKCMLLSTYLQNSLYICNIIGAGSFFLNSNFFQIERIYTNNNTPSMPLFDAHLEGFFFFKP